MRIVLPPFDKCNGHIVNVGQITKAGQKMLQIEDAEQLEQDSLSDDSLSDDDLEGVPLAGNWCTDGDY